MAWCPKCNEIYDDGISICPECNEPLIQGVPDDYVEIINDTDEEFALTTFNRLTECGFNNAQYYIDDNGCHILIDKLNKDEALIALDAEDALHDEMLQDEMLQNEALREKLQADDFSANSSTYVKKSDKYNDYKSSAISLLAVGIPGLIIMLIDMLGIIHINFFGGSNKSIFGIAMTALFSIFVLLGIYSLFKLRRIKPLMEKEEKLTEDIKRHINETFDPKAAGALISDEPASDSGSPENQSNNEITIYYKRCALLKKIIKEKFDIDDDNYLDYIIEDLYSKYFENR